MDIIWGHNDHLLRDGSYRAGLRHQSKWVRTAVALSPLISGQYTLDR